MRRARIAPIVLSVVLSGCSLEDVTGVGPAELDFSVESAGHGQYLEQPEVEATGTVRGLTVSSRLSTPDPCQRITGELGRWGTRVTVRVTIASEGQGCLAVVGTFRYSAVVRGLAPGRYTLHVVHDYPGTGWPSGMVLEQDVTVR